VSSSGRQEHCHGIPPFSALVLGAESVARLGLSLFFVLSSFLITALLLAEQGRTGAIHLGSFYLRRILRIWPLYLSFLLTTYIVGRFWAPVAFSSAGLFAFCLLSGNWFVLAGGAWPLSLGILWSISVEEQFYLVWPSILRLMTKSRIRQFCLGTGVVSLIGTYLLAKSGQSFLQVWCNTLSQMVFFAAGSLLALETDLNEHSKSGIRASLYALCGLLCWTAAHVLGFLPSNPDPAIWPAVYALSALGCAGFLWAFLHLPRFFIRRELVYLGRISYGLYVFHGLYLVLSKHLLRDGAPHLHYLWLPIAFIFTIGTAALSYQFLEKPFLKLKHRFEFIHSRAA
jgi:peptidoglycan/LPS O-acetylase OafA/YrhL